MRSVSWRIIVLQHPIIRKVPSDSLDPFSKLLQDIFVEGVINCLSWSYKFFVHNATAVEKNNNHGFHPGSAHACFLRTRRTFHVPFLTLPFGLGIVVEHPRFISCYYFMQIMWLNFESTQQILTNFQPVRFLLHRQVFRHQFFACANVLLEFYEPHFLFKPVSSAIILTLNRRSFAITARTTSTF